jgi:branched-chain amino acid transport system ATP-binding protein
MPCLLGGQGILAPFQGAKAKTGPLGLDALHDQKIDSSYLLRKAIMREVLKGVNLRKSFGGVHAVNNVSLEFKENEVCSIVGPNGAGKTTLINVLTDFIPLDAGSLFFMGEDISNLPKIARIKLGIARSFQTPALFENLTAIDNLRLAIFAQMEKSGILFRDYRKYTHVSSESIELLEKFKIPKDRQAKELDQGGRKLLDVAITLALKPKLLLLDEPTSGVSSQEKHDIIKTILNVQKENKLTIMMVEHDFDIAGYASRTMVMAEGKVIGEGNLTELLKDSEIKKILIGK